MTDVSDPAVAAADQATARPAEHAAGRADLVAALAGAVTGSAEILLVGHVNPDGASLGSALAPTDTAFRPALEVR
jgi:hypothetical protein